jgi:hypothetical protein
MQEWQVSRDWMRASLAAEALRTSGRIRLRVQGISMLGAIWPGDIVICESCKVDDVVVGDILLYRRDERLVLHRVIEVLKAAEGSKILTRGDSLCGPDSPIPAEDVLGRAISATGGRSRPRLLRRGRSEIQKLFSSLVAHSSLIAEVALRSHTFYIRAATALQSFSRETGESTVEAQT